MGARLGGGRGAANGGMIRRYADGGDVPVALMPGETVIYPDVVKRVGVSRLRKLNYADKKMAKGGGVGLVPGSGRTDSFYTSLPEGSFVIRTDATNALGGPDGVMKAAGYKRGGSIQKFGIGTKKPINKIADKPTNLSSSGPTEFTHIVTSQPIVPPKLQQWAQKNNIGQISRLYTNMGLDLPKTWNRNWAIPKKDNYGAYAGLLSSFIKNRDVFKTLRRSGKIYRFTGRSSGNFRGQ